MKRRLKCTKTMFCCMILGEVTDAIGGKGLVIWNFTNNKTGKPTRSLIGFKRKMKDDGMIFNFCPFCGGDWTNRLRGGK